MIMGTKAFIIWACIFMMLSLFFFHDGLGIHDKDGIPDHIGQGKVFSRVLKSSMGSLFSKGGLLGFCLTDGKFLPRATPENYEHAAIDCSHFRIYFSQSGGQAMLYSIIYLIYPDLVIFELVCGAFLSAVIVFWLMWIHRIFGVGPSIGVLLGVISLRYLVFLADNVALVIACNFMVFTVILWALELKAKRLGLIIGALFFVKYLLSGAEFVFPVMASAYLPLVFYGTKDGWELGELIHKAKAVSFAIILSSAIAAIILYGQISSVLSSDEAISHMALRFDDRSLCLMENVGFDHDQCQPRSIDNVERTISIYLDKTLIKFGWIRLKALTLIFIFLVATIFSCIYLIGVDQDMTYFALIMATWFSLTSPMTHFILMNGHALMSFHRQWVPVTWDMPFTLFGVLLCAVTLEKYASYAKQKWRSR